MRSFARSFNRLRSRGEVRGAVKHLKSFYLERRFFLAGGVIVTLFVLGYFVPIFGSLGRVGLIAAGTLLAVETLVLFRPGEGVFGRRDVPERLSNGDENSLFIHLENHYRMPVVLRVIDELPFQFQERNFGFVTRVEPRSAKTLRYSVRPVERGEYDFGRLNVYASTLIRFASRRYVFDEGAVVPVYPSFLQMRRYELHAVANRLAEAGVKKVRRIGHTMEFDQIRQYVQGDDIRTINWKATARHRDLMVNQYEDERSQQVYALIDKGRTMKMPFNGMTLLDYAINAALVISNIALLKHDRAGLITFSNTIDSIVPAERKAAQIQRIQEALYRQETAFLEADFERLYLTVRRKLHQRSLLLLFTNLETMSSANRQMPFLRRLARDHLLVVLFFENTELRALLESRPKSLSDIYQKSVAEKLAFDKAEIVHALTRHGMQAILTPPEKLTVNTINKYLELKARGLI